MFIHLFKYPNEESGKILKYEAAESYLEPCQVPLMERFCIIDVWYGSKYHPKVVQESKMNQ